MYERLKPFEKVIFDALSIFLVLYYAWSAVVEPAATQFHRGIYVIITYILCFLLYQSKGKVLRTVDYLLILASIVTVGYWMFNFEASPTITHTRFERNKSRHNGKGGAIASQDCDDIAVRAADRGGL